MTAIRRLLDSALDATIALSYDRSGFARHAAGFVPGDLNVDLSGRAAAVTGANSGIGLAVATALAARGASVSLLCRSAARGEAARDRVRAETGNDDVSLVVVDVSRLAQVDAAADALADRPLDVLVCNAGVLPDTRQATPDGHELTFATNVLGHHRLITRLLPRLTASPDGRVVQVSSGGMYSTRLDVHRLLDPAEPFDGVTAYAATKRAQVALTSLWPAHAAGVLFAAMHPGWADTPAVRSSLPRFHRVTRGILRTAEQGADTAVWLAACPHIRTRFSPEKYNGCFWFDRAVAPAHLLPWTRETDDERDRLWEAMAALTG